MPVPAEILGGLGVITNDWRLLAIFWHVYFGGLASILLKGFRPSRRMTGILIAIPLFSVSILAWISNNPFNGMSFALLAILLISMAIRLPHSEISISSGWMNGLGVLIFIFGWIYPHFLKTSSFVPYLYSAPTGLVPCPTLSIIIGFSLIVNGLGSRAWSLVLAAAGLFYGVFGAARLGVAIDLVLILGSLLMTATAFRIKSVQRTPAQAQVQSGTP